MRFLLTTWNREHVVRVISLLVVFSVVLGVSSLILFPRGITYQSHPVVHIFWLIFGIALVELFAAKSVSEIKISKLGAAATIALIILGLISAMPNGDLIARSVKLSEILFQDLVIAATLVVAGHHLTQRRTQLALALLFATLHVPLFFVVPFPRAITTVLGALFISLGSIAWFVRTKKDVSAIMLPHILFYILFGTALSVIFW